MPPRLVVTMQRRAFLASGLVALFGSPLGQARATGLKQRFSELDARLPRLRLARLPTPVHGVPRLGQVLRVPQLWVKRDDLISREYGGSKLRKLEFLLGEARARGCRHIVTGGSLGSHHALATAIHGSLEGFEVELLLLPEPDSSETRRVLAASEAHATVVHRIPTAQVLPAAWQRVLTRHGSSGYSIPLGGSSPLGAIGSVEAALELEEQIRAGQLPEPDRIYVPLGTMSLAVGLCIGLQLTQLRSRLIAVRASSSGTSSLAHCRELFDQTVALLVSLDSSVPRLEFDAARFEIDGSQLGRGYALPTPAGRRVLSEARGRAGLELELTYTAKALAAVAKDAKAIGDRPVLFWNSHAGSLDPMSNREAPVPTAESGAEQSNPKAGRAP